MKPVLFITVMLLLASAMPASADLLVKIDGNVLDGKVTSAATDPVIAFRPAFPDNAPVQDLAKKDVSQIIAVDAHGARTDVPPPEKWNVPPDPAAPPVVAPPKGNSYSLIPLQGEVGETFLASALEASLADAVQRHPTVVVLDIDSPGGHTLEVDPLIAVLHKYNSKLRIVALAGKDFSAAAIATLSVKEIYFKPTGQIGAARAFQAAEGGMPEDIAEKMQSAWRAVGRSSAEEGGHNPLLADAMIDASHFLYLDTDDAGKPVVREGMGTPQIVAGGRILTLTAHEAVACGLASGIVEDVADLGRQLKMPGWTAIPGLGTLLADELPKRQAAYDGQMRDITSAADIHMATARRNDPTAGSSEKSSFPQEQPDAPAGPHRPMIMMSPAFPRPIHPGMPPRAGDSLRGPMSGPPGRAQSSEEFAERVWSTKSLQCVVALQDVEQDLKRGVSLSQAFGRAGDAGDLQTALDGISELRQSIYDDRNRFASITEVPTLGGLVRSDQLPTLPAIPAPARPLTPPPAPVIHMPTMPDIPKPQPHFITPPPMPGMPPNFGPSSVPAAPNASPANAQPARTSPPAKPAMRIANVADAERGLASTEARDNASAARFLAAAAVDAAEQGAVIKALTPHLAEPTGGREIFVSAFAHWSRTQDMATLLACLERPAVPANTIADGQCWADAFPVLLACAPAEAEKAVATHKGEFFFRADVKRVLQRLIQDDSREKEEAQKLLPLLP